MKVRNRKRNFRNLTHIQAEFMAVGEGLLAEVSTLTWPVGYFTSFCVDSITEHKGHWKKEWYLF